MGWRDDLRDLGWSQAELAERLGVHGNTVSNWVKTGDAPRYAEAYLGMGVRLRRIGAEVWDVVHPRKTGRGNGRPFVKGAKR